MHEIADRLVDVYNQDRVNWLALHLNNSLLCDEAKAVRRSKIGGNTPDMFAAIGLGQYLAIDRIGRGVIAAVEFEQYTRNATLKGGN
jgi:hypothetical protein